VPAEDARGRLEMKVVMTGSPCLKAVFAVVDPDAPGSWIMKQNVYNQCLAALNGDSNHACASVLPLILHAARYTFGCLQADRTGQLPRVAAGRQADQGHHATANPDALGGLLQNW
jgi:hypothetical protein